MGNGTCSYIEDFPYAGSADSAYSKCKSLTMVDSDCYHLTNRGAYIYRDNNTWDSLQVAGNMQKVYGVFKDGDTWYLNLKDSLGVKNGDNWSFYILPSSSADSENIITAVNAYNTKFIKHENVIYFNVKNKGLFAFDGNTITTILNQGITTYSIFNNKIYYVRYMIRVCDLLGMPLAEGKPLARGYLIEKTGNRLSMLEDTHQGAYISYISDSSSSYVKSNFSLYALKLEAYNGGLLFAGGVGEEGSEESGLWYLDLNAVDFLELLKKVYRIVTWMLIKLMHTI